MKKILAMLAVSGMSILLLRHTAYAALGDPLVRDDEGSRRCFSSW